MRFYAEAEDGLTRCRQYRFIEVISLRGSVAPVKILCPGDFPCLSLAGGSPEAPVSFVSCHGMFAAFFIAPS
jgi:hypothetical protein